MKSLFFAILFIAGSAVSSPIANQYVESLLNVALRNEIRSLRLDPASVPDFTTEFQDKVAIIGKVNGKAEYSHGNLTGLSDAKRFSECQGPYYSFGARSVNCSISFHNLKINYEGKLKYGKMPKVNIKGKADVSTTVVFIELTQAYQGIPGDLKNIVFRQIGGLDIKFTGLGPLNKFTKFLEDGFRSHASAEVFNSMSQRYQYALKQAVSKVPFPN